MRITGVRTTLFESAFSRRLGDANHPTGSHRTTSVAVMLDTDDAGMTGIAVAGPGARSAIEGLVPALVGEDPRSVRSLWQRMIDLVFKGGHVGAAAGAVAALDIALWDLKAKAASEPLWKTLGASPAASRVAAYASGLDLPLSSEELRAFYTEMAALGFNAGKLKVGRDQAADLGRLAIMREALAGTGAVPVLMIDANEYWSAKEAVRRICDLEERFDLTWVEEPARRWDHHGLRTVRDMVKAAVASGENLQNVQQFTPLISNGAIDIVQISSVCGGITGALQVADLAYAFDLPASLMANPGHVLAHVAAAIPNHCTSEVIMTTWPPQGIRSQVQVADGCLVLDDTPGNGLSFPEDALARQAVDRPAADSHDGGLAYRRGHGAATHGTAHTEPA